MTVDTPVPGRDRAVWVTSVLMVTTFTAAAMVYAVVPALHPSLGPGWFFPGDATTLMLGGRRLLEGHLSRVYVAGSGLYALPLSFPLVGAGAEIAWHLGLRGSSRPLWILVIGPWFAAFGVPVVALARRLAWDMGIRRRLWVPQLVAVAVVSVPAFEWGHPEDVMALALALCALRRLMRGDQLAAAVWLSLSIASKQWAVILVPLVVACAPAGRRSRVAAASVAVPAVLAALFLAVDFHGALQSFFSPASDVGTAGHLGILGYWLGSNSSLGDRSLAVALAVLVVWLRRRRGSPAEILQTAAAVVMIRPLTELTVFSYYWSPGLLLLALAVMSAAPRVRAWHLVVPALAALWALPRSGTDPVSTLSWWLGEAVLLGVITVVLPRLDCRRTTGQAAARLASEGRLGLPAR